MASLDYYDRNIPCLAACPVHTNAGAYVAAIAEGRDEDAYRIAREPNPLASVCGRICAAPCEDACRRATVDQPVAIRALKRHVTERFGPESATPIALASEPVEERSESVGIVGSGPAGLAAAHDLRRMGYQVVLYEALDRLGGMMVVGIPAYRLDRSVIDAEIRSIVELGVSVQLGTRLGRDVTIAELRERHDAVFVAIGASLGRGLDIPGSDADGVFRALEFLINVNQGFQVDVGQRVVVVGGGNVAMDAARTALRADAYSTMGEGDEAMRAALDAARSAARAGATQVTIVSLESADEMPANRFEIEEAETEGIEFVHRRGPAAVVVRDGVATGLETIGVRSVFDQTGRFNPDFDPDDRSTIECDTVILAIGQAVDVQCLGDDGPALSPRRTIDVDADTLHTSLDRVWAGGDAAFGPRRLIDAVADGRRVASEVHRTLSGGLEPEVHGELVTVQGFHRLFDPYDAIERVPVPAVDTDRRIGLAEVETGYGPFEARREAARCLRCFANVQLDPLSCVLCGLCVDICPVDVLSLVPAGEVGQAGGTALLLDETGCIRCGLCIERCPPKALSMGVWQGVGVAQTIELVPS